MLREKMGEFMAKCSLNLGRRHLDELWVERDRLGPPTGETRRRPQPPIPLDGHLEIRTTCHPQQLAAESREEYRADGDSSWLRVDIFDLWQKAQMTKNRFSELSTTSVVSSGSDRLSLALDHRFERRAGNVRYETLKNGFQGKSELSQKRLSVDAHGHEHVRGLDGADPCKPIRSTHKRPQDRVR